jgi:hypothetical protein
LVLEAFGIVLGPQTVLKAVGQALEELGLIDSGVRLTHYINITAGDAMSISVFIDDRRFLQVKASEFVDLRKQYNVYHGAWSDYPALVPRPLGCLDRDGWSIMVCDGVLHMTVQRADVFRRKWRGPSVISGQLCEYFRGNRHSGAVAEAQGHATLVRDLMDHFQHRPLSRMAATIVKDAIALGVESMSPRPQHGDFVLNNLGRAGRRLLIFDWEDYGKVCFPGFDILTLYVSLLADDVDALRRLMNMNADLSIDTEVFLRQACEAQGVELAMFRHLVPFYLLVFLYLKRNYGARVQDRICALLQPLSTWNERAYTGSVI